MISINGAKVPFKAYPNGEVIGTGPDGFGTWLRDYLTSHGIDCPTVEFFYREDADLIQLAFLKTQIDTLCPQATLHIRYMPYSRMDRTPAATDASTLKVVASLINSLHFNSVIVDEPHSDVTMALLHNSAANYPTLNLLGDVLEKIGFKEDDTIFFPDAGAQKRYASLVGYNIAVGFKHRDFNTGKLSGVMEVVWGEGDYTGERVLIVDDLCSRGGTFVMAANELRKFKYQHVYLLVAHCEDTMWEGKLLDNIDGLFCTDSILTLTGWSEEDSPFREMAPYSNVHVYSGGKWL